ncbi:MAG TPA: hypothetical protein VEK38_03735, partial [Candidatus Bathyarchaeia archaeon]|nr:hypothetical protein [Candidatus Bathyarchaeia archaeon]
MKKELFFLLIFSHFTTQGMEEKKFIAIPCMPDQPYKPNTLTRPKCITSEKWNEIPHHYPHVLHVTAKELEGLPLFAAQYSGKFSIQPLKLSLPSGKDPTKSYVQELFFIAEHTVNTADTSCEERLEQFLQNKSDQDILDYHVDLNYLNVSDSCKNNLICACHTRYQSLQKKLKKKNLSKNEKQTIETFCEYIKTSYMNTVQITESITDYVGYKKFLLKNTDDTHIGTIEKTPADGAILLQSSHIKYPEHIQFILDKLNTQKRLPKKHRYVALFDTPIAITLYNTNLKSLCLDTFFKYLPYISHITLKNHEQITITNQDLRTYAKHAINITFDNCTFKKSVGPFYTQHFYRMRRTPIITFKGKFTEE